MDHVAQIKVKLGITGVLTEVHAWASRPDTKKNVKGAQIDLVIARKDRVINLCEMKYSINKYAFTKKDDESFYHLWKHKSISGNIRELIITR